MYMKICGKTFSDDCFASVMVSETNNNVFSSKVPRFSEFGKEIRRSFAVHECCYDCKRFVDGCRGWSAKRVFTCEKIQLYKRVEPG